MAELERSSVVKEKYRPLWDAVTVMAPSVRTLGTIGGTCAAVPSADMAPPLIVLGATVKLVGPKGKRSMPVESFFTGPKESALRKNEILTEVFIPSPLRRLPGLT